MNFQQIRDFVNPQVAQATGLQPVDDLQMPVPVAHIVQDLVIDGQLSDTSTNPVQNKVVKAAIDDITVQFEGGIEEAVDNWLDNNPDATTTVQDGAITYAKLDNNLKAKADEVTELKNAIDDIGVLSMNALTQRQGMINSTGSWVNINANNTHIIIPIKSGDKIDILPSSSFATYVAVLKDYATPVNGASVPLSTETGFTARITVAASTSYKSLTAPSDAKYLFFQMLESGKDAKPRELLVNGYDYAKSFATNYSANTKEFRDGIASDLNTYYDGVNELLPLVKKQKWAAWTGVDGKWQQVGSSSYEFTLIPVSGGEKYTIKTQQSQPVTWAVLTAFTAPVAGASISFSSATGWTARKQTNADSVETGTLPSDGRYVLICTVNSGVDQSPAHIYIDDIDHIKNVYGNLRNVIDRHINWCSMGDSIAFGTRSYMDGNTPAIRNDPDLGWACGVSKKNYYNWTNLCEPGGGYLYDDGGRQAAYTIARNTDYTQFDLVTLAYGLNDWKGHKPLGTVDDDASVITPTTTLQAMKATIEAIMTSNPLCKIIVITPLNASNFGNYAGNYALGYTDATSGKTLENFVEGIIDVCKLYGLQYIDNSHESVVNRLNITSLMLDGVHPTKEAHALIANEMAAKITNK